MGLLGNIIGPKSKYDRSIPYTYEARVPIIEGETIYNTYVADTICGLASNLEKLSIPPSAVEIFEIYQSAKKRIEESYYSTSDGHWINKPEMCQSFKNHYEGHIYSGGCTFEDRDFSCTGP